MHVTVVICSYNRCATLPAALESVANSEVPSDIEWEVLVVDNNSSDRTAHVVEEFCQRYPGRFHYLFEAKQGKSHALNTAIQHARGDIVTFVDDDVIVERTWLRNLAAALQDTRWSGAGGRIVPPDDFAPPRWLALKGPCAMGGVLVFLDLGDNAIELKGPPYGTNMAFRRSMFDKYGGFRTDLGPQEGTYIRGEDTEFGRRLLAGGERFWYEPAAVVCHPVPISRIRKEYFLAWWFDFGRGMVREWGRKPDICGIPRPYLSIAKLGSMMAFWLVPRWILACKAEKRFFYKSQVWKIAGEITEFYRLVRPVVGTTNVLPEGSR